MRSTVDNQTSFFFNSTKKKIFDEWQNELNSAEMRKQGKMNVVAVFYKIENELTLAMNHVKALKSLMKNVTESLTA